MTSKQTPDRDPGSTGGAPGTSPEAKQVAKEGLVLVVLVLATLLTGGFPLPYKVAALVFGALTLIWAVRYFVALARAKQRRSLLFGVMAVLVACYMLLVTLSSMVLWPVQSKYEECRRTAITQQAGDSCQAEYRQDMADWFKELTGQELVLPGS